MPTNPHRYYGTGHLHFITTGLHHHQTSSPPVVISEGRCWAPRRITTLFLEVMERVRQRHGFVVVGYVVMPEHVQL